MFDNIRIYTPRREGRREGERERFMELISYLNFLLYAQLVGTKCGRTTFSLPTGLIPSPQYPLNYRPGESCEYEIQVKPGHDLSLMTRDFKVPTHGVDAKCTSYLEDRIQVLKKETGSKIYTNVTSFCGNHLYPDLTIKGASSVLLQFTSNSVREGRFLLQYLQVPASLPN